MNRIYYTVYETKNKINNKTYIGVHKTNNPNDGYLGSGKALYTAIQKYGKDNFYKTVIFNAFTYEDAHYIERQLVNDSYISNPDTYNMKVGGRGGSLPKTQKQKDHLSNINKGKPSPRKGVRLTEETKKLIGSYHKGKFVDPEISKNLWKQESFRKMITKENHHSAKEYVLTDPVGNIFKVKGRLKEFANQHSLLYNALKSNVNMGLIQPPSVGHRRTQASINTYGWTIELQCPQISPV